MKQSSTKRVFSYFAAYKGLLLVVLLLAVLSTCFTVLAPELTGMITTKLYEGVAERSFDWITIGSFIAALVILYLLAQVFAFLQNFWMSKISANVMGRMRKEIDEKIHRLELNYYDTHTHGDMLSVVTNDVDMLNNTISQNLTQIVTQIITAVGILIMMLRTNIWMALVAVIAVPLSLLASKGVMASSRRYFGRQQDTVGKLNGYIEELYAGQSVVQSFNYQEQAQRHFDEINNELKDNAEKAETFSGFITPLTSVVNNIGYVVSAVLGCTFALKGGMAVGQVQSMLQYQKQFGQPFTSIASMAGSFGAAAAAAERIFALLDAQEEIPDAANGAKLADVKGAVEFRNVSFGYTPEQRLMKNINLTVSPGQKVAIVGPTGAGKTTLVNLLMRFYEINEGSILVDGIDTRSMSREELRNAFGMVLQETWLFEGTIRDSLAYGRDGLTEEEIRAAAESACADTFIRTLPDGYNMRLEQSAENISQGERQLLTIARAIASKPQILILDEATSNVDTHTEMLIQKAMSNLMQGHTSFVIAHRLSTIRDAALILYMENGNIVEMGSHDTLMAAHGKYEALYNSQFAV